MKSRTRHSEKNTDGAWRGSAVRQRDLQFSPKAGEVTTRLTDDAVGTTSPRRIEEEGFWIPIVVTTAERLFAFFLRLGCLSAP